MRIQQTALIEARGADVRIISTLHSYRYVHPFALLYLSCLALVFVCVCMCLLVLCRLLSVRSVSSACLCLCRRCVYNML